MACRRKNPSRCRSLGEIIGASWRRRSAPGHERHGGCGILRRALDNAVAVDQINQHIALRVAAADDLHLLEEERPALAVDLVTLLEFILDGDRADLPAGNRYLRTLLRESRPARPAADLRHGEMTRYAGNVGVIDGI